VNVLFGLASLGGREPIGRSVAESVTASALTVIDTRTDLLVDPLPPRPDWSGPIRHQVPDNEQRSGSMLCCLVWYYVVQFIILAAAGLTPAKVKLSGRSAVKDACHKAVIAGVLHVCDHAPTKSANKVHQVQRHVPFHRNLVWCTVWCTLAL
jgi:hypothetical protein